MIPRDVTLHYNPDTGKFDATKGGQVIGSFASFLEAEGALNPSASVDLTFGLASTGAALDTYARYMSVGVDHVMGMYFAQLAAFRAGAGSWEDAQAAADEAHAAYQAAYIR